VVERQAELALLTAVGFEAGVLGRLLWWEHARLLALGLCVGGLAAVVAVGPVLAAPDAHPPWGLALAVWTGTAAVGTLALAVSVRRALAAVPIRVLIRDG
jgi:Predicted permease.